jgi:cadmium resistance transport/sequestration family protein
MDLIIASLFAFASTNIDDIFVIILFFANNRYKTKQVVIGQYLGISVLIAISLAGSLIGLFISKSYIGLLGVIPIFLGIKSGISRMKKKDIIQYQIQVEHLGNSHRGNVFSVASVTFANGGDNIGIYIPLFATLNAASKAIMITIFLCMVGIWCFVARYLSKHPVIAKPIRKYGDSITPIVLILLGIYILYESGSLTLISSINLGVR